MKYSNTLPDIPFDLKYITYPFATDRFVQYNPTSLERNYKYEVLTEHDLGVTIDLINRDLYQSDPNLMLDPADEKLLEEELHTPQDSQRSRHHAKSVSWLRKSEYISTEQTRFQPQNNEKVEAKVGFNVRKSFVEETLYMDREAQIKSIEKTFEDIKNLKTDARHYRYVQMLCFFFVVNSVYEILNLKKKRVNVSKMFDLSVVFFRNPSILSDICVQFWLIDDEKL